MYFVEFVYSVNFVYSVFVSVEYFRYLLIVKNCGEVAVGSCSLWVVFLRNYVVFVVETVNATWHKFTLRLCNWKFDKISHKMSKFTKMKIHTCQFKIIRWNKGRQLFMCELVNRISIFGLSFQIHNLYDYKRGLYLLC